MDGIEQQQQQHHHATNQQEDWRPCVDGMGSYQRLQEQMKAQKMPFPREAKETELLSVQWHI